MSPTDVVEDQARYRLADGTLLELYSEANEFHGFFKTGAVVGFAVDDFDQSWTRLTRIGIEALTDIQQDNGQKWVHFPPARRDDCRTHRRDPRSNRLRSSSAPRAW